MARTAASLNFRLDPRPVRGFSLFELMLVMIIAGVVAAIAIPRFAGAIARTRLERSVHRLIEDIELTRRSARAASTTKTLVFDPSAASYSVAGLFARDLSSEPFSSRMPAASFAGNTYLEFDGYGMPTTSGLISIRTGDYFQIITVTASTGKVTKSNIAVTKDKFIEPAEVDLVVIEDPTPSIKIDGVVLALPDTDLNVSEIETVEGGGAIPLN